MPKTPLRGERIEVGIRQLRDRLSHYLSEVMAGRTVVITDRGRPVARIIGVDAVPPGLQAMIDRGVVTPARRPAGDPDARPRINVEGGIADLLDDQRR